MREKKGREEENVADRPTCEPKDPEYFKKYYINVVKPKVEARQAEELNNHIPLPMLTALLGTTITGIIALLSSH